MSILETIKSRFRPVLMEFAPQTASALLEMIRPAQDSRFGDFQANFAMPLAKQLGANVVARELAMDVLNRVKLDDFCEPPQVAGPGFINLRIRDGWLVDYLDKAVADPRCGVRPAEPPCTYVVDYSSPNVAKPMHVGHIRTTVIGDALDHVLRFLGHRVISDNHLGDWGTQFGMIIYGYKHFVDRTEYEQHPVQELGRLYRLVNKLVGYFDARQQIPELRGQVQQREAQVARSKSLAESDKKKNAEIQRAQRQLNEAQDQLQETESRIRDLESDPQTSTLLAAHPRIADDVLRETALLHAGDAENLRLWHEFLPNCRDEIQRVYRRLNVRFDFEYGESFYHDQLHAVVQRCLDAGIARESNGAICVFLDGFETPMIVRKSDGAFLYATTDLATIEFRARTWNPDVILYVVDHRQSEHFEKLFAAARLLGYGRIDFRHIKFGTILDDQGKPFRTRSGDTVGLEGLLDQAVQKAHEVICKLDDEKRNGRELSDEQRARIAEVIGIGAIKYGDQSQNRESDYKYSLEKMVALDGNTITYLQYSHARVCGIFRKAEADRAEIRAATDSVQFALPADRALAMILAQFQQALLDVIVDYRPNLLTTYLYDLAKAFHVFFENCPVRDAETVPLRTSRLKLCDLTARIIEIGLSLLGIPVVDRM
jgi:arginyl-tRNA synthetase